MTGHKVVMANWLEMRAFPVLEGLAVFWRDISVRKAAEEALRESEEWQAFLLKLSDTIRPLSDPIEIQKAAMKLLAEQFDVMRASYFEVEADQDTFTLTAMRGMRHRFRTECALPTSRWRWPLPTVLDIP